MIWFSLGTAVLCACGGVFCASLGQPVLALINAFGCAANIVCAALWLRQRTRT